MALVDLGAARIGEESRFISLDHLGDDARIGERVVGPEHDALRQRDVIERAEGLFPGRERVVVPEMLKGGVNLRRESCGRRGSIIGDTESRQAK